MMIQVHATEEPARFQVAPATHGKVSEGILGAEEAARYFVEDLVQLGEIDVGAARDLPLEISSGERKEQSHALVPVTGGGLVLMRNYFDCGFCPRSTRAI